MAAPITAPTAASLIDLRTIPAETFVAGPPSGQFEDRGDHGYRLERPRFASQPVQGVSSIKPGPRAGSWWALSDNGFGSKWNSLDYRSCIYLFDARLRLVERIELRDPRRHFPHRLIFESDPARPLTGGDIDPESLVVMPDGSFWIGDEIGPWLLHFSRGGILLEPPVPAMANDIGELRSVNHPQVLAQRSEANVRASSGFESLVAIGRGRELRLIAMLERPLALDGPDAPTRLLEFDPRTGRWTGREWRYRLDAVRNAVAELAASGDGGLLAIERDNLQGDAAQTKKIFRLPAPDSIAGGAVLPKTLVVDLLSLADPQRIASPDGVLRFSYQTTESVHALDARTLVVVNDNNFPASGGRGGKAPDPTEWIWIRLNR